MNGVKIIDGFVNEPVIKDGPMYAVNPINDVADKLVCELLVMSEEVFIISLRVVKKLLKVAVVDNMLQNLQLIVALLQKHLAVYTVSVLVLQ